MLMERTVAPQEFHIMRVEMAMAIKMAMGVAAYSDDLPNFVMILADGLCFSSCRALLFRIQFCGGAPRVFIYTYTYTYPL